MTAFLHRAFRKNASPDVSPESPMIVPGLLFRNEFLIESIAHAIDD